MASPSSCKQYGLLKYCARQWRNHRTTTSQVRVRTLLKNLCYTKIALHVWDSPSLKTRHHYLQWQVAVAAVHVAHNFNNTLLVLLGHKTNRLYNWYMIIQTLRSYIQSEHSNINSELSILAQYKEDMSGHAQ